MQALVSRLLLINPRRVERHASAAKTRGLVNACPNRWQLCLGALRMWHRIFFRSSTIGTSSGPPRRDTWRARILEHRAIRLPVLLACGAVAPWDLTGLYSSPERIIRHLLAAHHDRKQFVFDLQLLACHPGRTAELVDNARRVVTGEHRWSEALRDVVVYSGYHEALLEAVEGAKAATGPSLSNDEKNDPDVSLTGLLRWCAAAPPTPRATLHALYAGSFRFSPFDPSDPRSQRVANA